MNKSFACLSAAVLISGFGAWVVAQPPGKGAPQQPIQQTGGTATPTAAPGTRVAVINMNNVLKLYGKAQALNNQIKNKVQAYAQQMNQKKQEITNLQAELTKPTTTPQMREKFEKDILAIQRVLQDLDNEARKVISKEQEGVAVQIYREIETVVKAVAVANGFDLVLSYPDATTDAEMYSQDNVIRKMANQAAIPVFYRPHIDLTDAVVKTLNTSFPVAAPPASPAGTTPSK